MAVGDPYPEMVICDISLNRQTSDYTYAQIPYIERLAFPNFLRSIRFFCVAMLQTPFVCMCVCVCVCMCVCVCVCVWCVCVCVCVCDLH